MAQIIEVLSLDINTNALISKMTETRAEIDKLKAAQKTLTDSNQTNSDSFTKNVVEIARLQTSYNAQKNVVAQLSTANQAFAKATDAATQAIAKENTSIAEARENNKQLLAIRNQINTKTTEGQTAVTAINSKLDENNKYIKDNVSGLEKQKIGIGDYGRAITESVQALGLQGVELRNVNVILEKSSGTWNFFKGQMKDGAEQIKNSASATEGMTTAQKAMTIATGVGTGAMKIFTAALAATGIGLIIIAVGLLIGYFKTFDPLVDKLEQGFAAMGAAVRVVQQALASLFDSTQDSSKSFSELGDNMAKAAKDAAKLKAAQQDLADLNNSQEVANAKAIQQYAELILKSKNRTLTEKDRLAFLKQAEAIETANFKQRSALADADLKQSIEAARIKGSLSNQELANLQRNTLAYGTYLLNQGKITDKELQDLKKSELGKIAIKDESTKRLEKNQNAQDKLEDDATAKREKAQADAQAAQQKAIEAHNKKVDAGIQKNKDEIDLYIQQQGIKKQSMVDELSTAETVMNKKLALLKTELDNKKITQTAFELESLKLKNDFAKKQADVTVANANIELQNFKDTHQSKIDANQFLNDTLYQQELERIRLISEAEATAAKASFDAGITNKTEYDAAIAQIDLTTATNKKAVDDAKIVADNEKKIIDATNKQEIDELEFQTKFEADTAREQMRYDAELLAADKNGADRDLIEQKHAANQKAIDGELQKTKIAALGATLGVVSDLLGKSSKAGKAVALAQALINTYQGITAGVALGYPMAIPAVAMAAATGFAAVKNIISTKDVPKRADGGLIPTLSSGVINNGSNIVPLSNGDDTLAYVGQGELILNKEQQARAGGFQFFKSIGVPTYATGGYVGNQSISNTARMSIDYDRLAASVAQAYANAPAPVVSVVDINHQQNRVRMVDSYANLQ
ncbi:hypothetical protein [Flavobacterium muglaense]|uniref:Uncharacterized protein n=1 Tax=Flavobacterium muglaense TaxID=2764716 RepID=A0A923MXB8_9FLAO|nr:hypothetical protein [Flavobacterium muglaense]MBC5836779.1 hypothetical protein [Flavobacterium muglaense]MBC5843271.1 hypothetical protein [Flavobacterium muglaense]